MRKMKTLMAFLAAMTMTVGAMGVTAHAESYPIDVNEEFEGLRGDINNDGQITIRDACLLAKYLRDNETDKFTAKADYNMDGYVDVRDAALMAKDMGADYVSPDYADDDYSLEAIIAKISVNFADPSVEYKLTSADFEGIKGDIDNDGAITIRDVSKLALALEKGMDEKLTAQGDMDDNGAINITDVALIQKQILDEIEAEEFENDLIDKLEKVSEDDSIKEIEDMLSEYIDNNAPETEESAEQSKPAEPTGIMGDVNYDGVLSIRDAALIAKYMSHPEYLTDAQINAVTAQGDFNGDGRVSVRDVSDIAKYLDKSAKNKENTESSDAEYTSEGVKVKDEDFEGVRGDLNGDGEATLRDAALISKYLHDRRYDELTAKADYNMDGYVNVRDAAAIAKKVLTGGEYGDINSYSIVRGDADLNGEVDLADLTAIAKYNLNSEAYPLKNEMAFVNADVNGDDKVDALDITALIEEQLGK